MKERVQKIISNSGYCSRRKAEELIEKGKVKVNGKKIKLGDKATATDKITINNQELQKDEKVYIMLNKPKGYECTLKEGTKNILKLVQIPIRVYPVGRLDKLSEGLLLLTNDGDFSNKITHPNKKVNKTYIAKLDKQFDKKDKPKLEKGVRLRYAKVKPKIYPIDKKTIRIVLHEGQKHVIKRMMFKFGYFVKQLTRTKIGNLKLDVKKGKWRFLTEKDMKKIFS
jgi:pseudouridine synthase